MAARGKADDARAQSNSKNDYSTGGASNHGGFRHLVACSVYSKDDCKNDRKHAKADNDGGIQNVAAQDTCPSRT